MTHVVLLGNVPPDILGLLPFMLDDKDPRPAREQFDANYQHGGGWHPVKGFKKLGDFKLKYPGDPAMAPIAMCKFRDELVMFYPHAFVMVLQKDNTFEVARMD